VHFSYFKLEDSHSEIKFELFRQRRDNWEDNLVGKYHQQQHTESGQHGAALERKSILERILPCQLTDTLKRGLVCEDPGGKRAKF
jgi:hypothetical protein